MRPRRSNSVRIIGGRWRGRILRFPDVPGLRPTPDRMRETVFNWLGQRLDGLRCLDLFAGSGALGFEAASRGAVEVVMLEQNARVAMSLRENVRLLDAEATVWVLQGEALTYLATDVEFDVIFLDPPFKSDLLPKALALAATCLAPQGRIYAETGDDEVLPPSGLGIIRHARAGMAHSYLLERV